MKLDMDEVKDSILSYVSGLDVTWLLVLGMHWVFRMFIIQYPVFCKAQLRSHCKKKLQKHLQSSTFNFKQLRELYFENGSWATWHTEHN